MGTYIQDMPPDKELEERVLFDQSEYLSDNLPADDVAPMMATHNLLTPRELIEYNAMKRRGMSTIQLSEYLMECLRKRKAGFLRIFCAILWEIEPAKYLGDHIQDAYQKAMLQRGEHVHLSCVYCIPYCLDIRINAGFSAQSSNRLSRVSLSDTDLSQRSKVLDHALTKTSFV